jgi:mono/diheme cytochrome c family protein
MIRNQIILGGQRVKTLKIGILFAAAVMFPAACTGSGTTNTTSLNSAVTTSNATPMPAATMLELASGRDIYADNWAKCHKDDGTGGPVEINGKKLKPDDLTSAKIKGFSDEKIIGYVKDGVEDEGMPAFKEKLTDEQIREVVAYIRKDLQKQ